MTKYFFLFLSIVCFSCTKKIQTGKFEVTGILKNAADQKIYLDQVYFSGQSPEALDTAEMTGGHFTLNATAPEEGFFRIRMEKETNTFFFINDQPLIHFNADIKEADAEAFDFESPANENLRFFIDNYNLQRKAFAEQSLKVDSIKTLKKSDSLLKANTDHLAVLNRNLTNFIIQYIDSVNHPALAMFALGYTRELDPELLKTPINNLAKRFPKHEGLQVIIGQYDQMMAQKSQSPASGAVVPQLGNIAPELTMNDENDKPFSLSQLRGKYVLIDFWASWCGPCRTENPVVVAAYNKFQNKNFTILGVSLDKDKSSWIKAINEDNLTWKHISDLKQWNSEAVSLYGFEGIPYNVLLDPQGKILATELRGDALDKKLAEVLK